MRQQHIPDFMQGYLNSSNDEGKALLHQLAKQYEEERANFLQTTFVQKQNFQRDWNKLTGQRKELTVDDALKPINEKYKLTAEGIAAVHGRGTQQEEENVKQKQTTERKQEQQPTENPKQEHDSEPEEKTREQQFLQNKQDIREQQNHGVKKMDDLDVEAAYMRQQEMDVKEQFKQSLQKMRDQNQKMTQRP